MKNSIFTKVLALVLCVIMLAGTLTACLPTVEFNPSNGTTTENGGKTEQSTTSGGDTTTTPPETTTTTGDGTTENPSEDPAEDPEEDPVDPNELYSGKTTLESDSLLYGTLANDVFIGDESVAAMIPADVKVEAGASALALSIKNVEEATTVDGEALSNLDVHISGIALDNTVPMTVMLGAILPIGLANTELKLYHVENGTPVLMTRVASVNDFAIHNQYVYNAETGVVTIYVASFSVFTAVQTSADVWDGESVDYSWYNTNDTEFILTTAAQFAGFRDIVDGTAIIDDKTVQDSFAGKTVKLGVDVDLGATKTVQVEKEVDGQTQLVDVIEKIPFDPIGYGYTYGKDSNTAFMGTFDGGNHTVYNLYQNGWDLDSDKTNYSTYTYSTAGGGLFASIENATIKNLAVSGADIVFECIDMGIVVGYAQGNCHFENIVVTDSRIANYNRATGGVVGEVCYGSYGTDVELGYSHTFENITVDSSVVVSSLWGSFDTLCGGVIGGKWGNATVKMTNVNVAARLDVFSDVTAAYEWYAYRRCGMLIGHTEQNSPKKALNAAAEFLTCENVNVYYGDWVNYSYCQFTQYGYPWARVQAGEYHSAYANPRIGVAVDINGKTVVDNNHAHKDGEGHNLFITFNQLYGGGQGVYGAANHTANNSDVTIHNSLKKTVYINNNLGWKNLTLDYWFANGDARWSTLVDDMGITEVSNGIYKVVLPAYADGFKIFADGDQYKKVMTPEILLSGLTEKSTYPLSAFQVTLSIEGAKDFVVNAGDFLHNTPVYNDTNPRAERYDVIVYDKNYTGTFTTNPNGVAIVLDATGKLIEIYDAANGGYWKDGAKVEGVSVNVNTFATDAWTNSIQNGNGKTLIIFPNDGVNNASSPRTWALTLRNLSEGTGSMGKTLTIITTINPNVHICSDMCLTCLGCRNKDCTHNDCVNNRCNCLDISIKVDIEGFENNFVVTENNWLYNTQIDRNHYPYASHYQVVIYDQTYDFESAPFTTNEFGIAVVLDADGKIVKIYDAANGDRSVVYYDANGSEVIIAAGEKGNGNDTYATLAWSELEAGEKLAIFPNHKSDNSARNWAKKLCENWANGLNGATAIITATFKLPTTIYFQNTQNWTNVGIKYWYEDGTELTGVLVKTGNDGLHDVYRVVLPANVVKVAFGEADAEENVTVSTPEITSLHNGYIYVVNGSKVNSTLYKEGYKTIYFQNNWLWGDVRLYYWYNSTWHNAEWPGQTPKEAFDNDGSYDYYQFVIPSYAEGFVISGTNHDEPNRREQFVNVMMNTVTNGQMYKIGGYANGCDKLDSSNSDYKKTVTVSSQDFDTYKAGYKVVNLKPSANWKKDSARFAVYAFASTTDFVWANLSDKDGDGIYSGWIPTKYTKVIFCRMKVNTANDWVNKLAQTADITSGVVDGYTYTVVGRIYFKPDSNWLSSNARFAVYFFNDTTNQKTWVSMTKDGSTGYYYCDLPVDASWEKMIFVRMNPSYSTNSWNTSSTQYVWNQTGNLDIPLEGGNIAYILKTGSDWNNVTGSYWTKK